MIYTFIPYSPDLKKYNLGAMYNKFMRLLPNDDDWACLIDHDVMFTRKNWYHQLMDIIKKHPDYGCLTGRTNRIGCSWQKVRELENSNNIEEHKRLGKELQDKFWDEVEDRTNDMLMSGFLMLVKKSVWKEVPFREVYERDGMAGVDNHFHEDLKNKGYKIGLMKGVYLYHWYGKE